MKKEGIGESESRSPGSDETRDGDGYQNAIDEYMIKVKRRTVTHVNDFIDGEHDVTECNHNKARMRGDLRGLYQCASGGDQQCDQNYYAE